MKAVSTRGRRPRVDTSFRGMMWGLIWKYHVIIYLSLMYYCMFLEISKIYQCFSFLFVSSFVSPIVFGLVRMLLDVFTIFFSFLVPYFNIFVRFPCYFYAGLVQTISKSPRQASKTSMTSAILILWRQRCKGVRHVFQLHSSKFK